MYLSKFLWDILWNIFMRYLCEFYFLKRIRSQSWLHSVDQWPARWNEQNVVMYFSKFSWDIFVKFCHEIFTWDIFVKILHEIFTWDILVKILHEIFTWDFFIKKLGKSPGSIQLTSSLQCEKNRILSCIFLNFDEIFF